jgi:exopolysaccharide biosynthesis protein
MKKLIYFLLFLSGSALQLFAQNDSLTLVKSKWTQKKLVKKVVWKTIHFNNNNLFNANQNINIIEIGPRARKARLAVVYSDSLEKTSAIGQRTKAIASINGSFFKMRGADPDYNPKLKGVPKFEPSNIGKNRSVVYLRVNDSLIAKQVFTKDSVRQRHQQGVVAIKQKEVSILEADINTPTWENKLKARDVISTGPVMLLGGVPQAIPNDAFCNDRHPLSALRKIADVTVVLFAVDGRNPQSAGMSIPELLKTMKWLGCTEAINLDGGGSTTMYIKGQPFNGVVNYPTDNKQFDHLGEREVANALVLLSN